MSGAAIPHDARIVVIGADLSSVTDLSAEIVAGRVSVREVPGSCSIAVRRVEFPRRSGETGRQFGHLRSVELYRKRCTVDGQNQPGKALAVDHMAARQFEGFHWEYTGFTAHQIGSDGEDAGGGGGGGSGFQEKPVGLAIDGFMDGYLAIHGHDARRATDQLNQHDSSFPESGEHDA